MLQKYAVFIVFAWKIGVPYTWKSVFLWWFLRKYNIFFVFFQQKMLKKRTNMWSKNSTCWEAFAKLYWDLRSHDTSPKADHVPSFLSTKKTGKTTHKIHHICFKYMYFYRFCMENRCSRYLKIDDFMTIFDENITQILK